MLAEGVTPDFVIIHGAEGGTGTGRLPTRIATRLPV
jgi:glutamate synthase domain-containing protein 2